MEEDGVIVTLVGDDGEENEFEHLLTFEHEGGHYVALLPLGQEQDAEEAEVVLMRIQEDSEWDSYLPIDDEALLKDVFNTFLELMEQPEDEE